MLLPAEGAEKPLLHVCFGACFLHAENRFCGPVVALEILDNLDTHTGFIMPGVGLMCLELLTIQKRFRSPLNKIVQIVFVLYIIPACSNYLL